MLSLRSKITKKVLTLMFQNKKQQFYVNELAKKISEDPSNVYKKILELKTVGILKDHFLGKERYFRLNQDFSLLKEYKRIFLQQGGFEKIVQDFLGKGKVKGIIAVYAIGPHAEGKNEVDLLIVSNAPGTVLGRALDNLREAADKKITVTVLSEEEFKRRRATEDPLLEHLFSKEHLKLV